MPDRITKILKAIADPTRRDLLNTLVIAATALPIHELAAPYSLSRQGITKHLKVMEDAGLISIYTAGRSRYCNAHPEHLIEVKKWLDTYEKFWDTTMDKLGKYLDSKA